MKKNLLFLAKLFISLALLLLIVQKIDWRELRELVTRAETGLILAALAVSVLNLFVSNLRWYLLIQRRSGNRIGFWNLMDLSLVGLFFNTLVPGGIAGDFIRGHRARQYHLKGREAFASVIVDRLLGFLGLMVLSTAGAILCWSTASTFEWQKFLICLYIMGIVGAFVLISPLVSGWIHHYAPRSNALVSKSLKLYDAIAAYPRHREFWTAFVLSLITGGMLIGTIILLSMAFEIFVPPIYLIWLVPTVGILSTLPISLSGWGIREAGYVFFLEQIGIPTAQGLVLSVSFGGIVLFMGALGGIWYFSSTLFPKINNALAPPGVELSGLPNRQA